MKFLPILTLLLALTVVVGLGWPVALHNFEVAVAYWTGGEAP